MSQVDKQKGRSTALDFYSGVGGWTLGLEAAGIRVASSFEWWGRAAETARWNHRHPVVEADIRRLDLGDLPKVDFVVGSPPCTEFSFANRGGGGDLAEGLRDIEAFLEVVAHLRPRGWAMENVPRVAKILAAELAPSGSLARFNDLVKTIVVVDASDFGAPQRRRRMLAGSFSKETLLAYAGRWKPPTLGQVIGLLQQDPVLDPNWDGSLPIENLTGNELEEPLDLEEERLNRAAKTFHPVYNNMQFPDALDRTARTITATCTRVSRESIVVPDSRGGYRRLSVRERATLQAFPVSYQFLGRTVSENVKMIGNAIPPTLAYFVACALRDLSVAEVKPMSDVAMPDLDSKRLLGLSTPKVEGRARFYPERRAFRGAIPGLRFGSGLRFELCNQFDDADVEWKVRFFFGTSKAISMVVPTPDLVTSVIVAPGESLGVDAMKTVAPEVERLLMEVSPESLQARWSHRRSRGPHPFDLVDELGTLTAQVVRGLASSRFDCRAALQTMLGRPLTPKLQAYATEIAAGMVVAAGFNGAMSSL